MKENIKLFKSLQAADGYVIKDIPFITTVKREEVSLEPQNLHCNESDKKLKKVENIIVIENSAWVFGNSIPITYS